ncbi:MAG: gliding motility lipoprotein GldH [Bacteroidota bacterium]
MKKCTYVFAVMLILLTSCSKRKVFQKYTDIENYKWKRENVIKFEVPIKDVATNYDVVLALRHTSYYAFANILVNVSTTYPAGDLRTKDYNVMLRNTDGKFIGAGAGDLWDITYPVLTDVTFPQAGTYTFEIQNVMPVIELPDIMQVGLIVRKAEKTDKTEKGD